LIFIIYKILCTKHSMQNFWLAQPGATVEMTQVIHSILLPCR
jgi:hypothetical protein